MFTRLFKRFGKEAKLVLPPPPFGYKAPLVPVTTQNRYNPDVINAYVRAQCRLEKTDEFLQAHAEDIYKICDDYIAHLPPYRQVLLMDGDRPTGEKRTINFGESHIIRRKGGTAVYEFWFDSIDIKTQTKTKDGTLAVLRSKDDIQNSISHETGHREDKQILYVGRDGPDDPWSMTSKNWESALALDMGLGNFGLNLQTLLPGTEILMQHAYYQNPIEGKAEIEKIFCQVYRALEGDMPAACAAMENAYPNAWPVFHDEYLALATATAAKLNPHIDLRARPSGFENASPQTSIAPPIPVQTRHPAGNSVL